VRLCDGAWVDWPSVGRFDAIDEDFGTIDGVDAVTESLGDEAIGGTITLLPPSITSAGDLFMPTAQGGAIRGWQAEIDPATNQVVGTPALLFSVQVDTARVVSSRERRTLDIDFIDAAEKLWMVREGNVLSPRWHKANFAGETGLDAATGSPVAVPWGISGPARGSISGGSGGGSTVGSTYGGGNYGGYDYSNKQFSGL
jgi:hypothetical protein